MNSNEKISNSKAHLLSSLEMENNITHPNDRFSFPVGLFQDIKILIKINFFSV